MYETNSKVKYDVVDIRSIGARKGPLSDNGTINKNLHVCDSTSPVFVKMFYFIFSVSQKS
jgi:hypothetical protein